MITNVCAKNAIQKFSLFARYSFILALLQLSTEAGALPTNGLRTVY